MRGAENQDGSDHHTEVQSKDKLDDLSFLSNCYTPLPIFKETYESVAAKVSEIEKEIDKLSPGLNEAYYIAVDQEIKQRTNYVRSTKFLLMFLRAESFDAGLAALRMAHFFRWKLNLFGLEKLPRPIIYEDLNEDDKKVLRSECFHYSGVDCEGRPILTIQLKPLIVGGLFHQRYADSMDRIGFYVRMCMIEGNEVCQKYGMVVIKWGLECKLSLNDFRLLISPVKLYKEAMPMKLVAIHDCRPDTITPSWISFITSFLPKEIRDRYIAHCGTSLACYFSALSQYGIDVDALPRCISGNETEDIDEKLVQLQLKNLSTLANNFVVTEETRGTVMNYTPSSPSRSDNLPDNMFNDKKSAEFDELSLDLMEVLEKNAAPNAICWSSGGTSIRIFRHEFRNDMLPDEFGGIKFDSFIRKLLRCGFKRLNNRGVKDLNFMEFEHPQFQKKSEQLLKNWELRDKQPWKKGKFPVKLMHALENKEMSHTIWWVCDGNAIAIEKHMFPSTVLDKYFPGLKMESFYRMLGKWGFHRLPEKETSSNVVVFQNTLFKKSMSHLDLCKLKRGSVSPQPNFFEKLYSILESDMAHDSIWWLDDGGSFAIHTINFTSDVLSREYNGIKFKSFRRSLIRWNFKQMSKNGKIVIFQHPKFQKEILSQSAYL